MSESLRQYKAAWYQKNKERTKILRRIKNAANRERLNASLLAYKKANPERVRQIQARHRAKSKEKYVAHCAKRYARKLQATPSWANSFLIQEAYLLSALRTKATGVKWHVDHIIPLKSDFVCGLHVESNLRVIPAVANQRKNNRYWPDMA